MSDEQTATHAAQQMNDERHPVPATNETKETQKTDQKFELNFFKSKNIYKTNSLLLSSFHQTFLHCFLHGRRSVFAQKNLRPTKYASCGTS